MVQNILVIGIGPHTETNHLPILAELRGRGRVGQIIGFDISSAACRIERLRHSSGLPTAAYYTSERWTEEPPGVASALPQPVACHLDDIVRRHRVQAAVIACEPSYHSGYAQWAIRRGLHTLIDKPTAMRAGASLNTVRARAIFGDYQAMSDAYRDARAAEPRLTSVVLCQRRYHPLYRRVWELVEEVAERTGCAVTSMQSFHADGQWRLPHELVDLTYHSCNRGYGKVAHSGYHFIDYLSSTVRAGARQGAFEEVDIFANVSRPADYLAQLGWPVHDRCFSELPFSDRDVTNRIFPQVANHGEVDAFISLAFKRGGRVVALGSINLLHNGLSLRERAAANPDLYRGNGRIRHESHIVEQGPFQAIYIRSYRSGDGGRSLHEVGGYAHLELEVFRNNRLVPGWRGYERVTIGGDGGEQWCDPQKAARKTAVEEYMRLANGELPPGSSRSDLRDHALSSALLAGAYESMAARAEGGNPVVTITAPASGRLR
jgi:predicted dehydrogenase